MFWGDWTVENKSITGFHIFTGSDQASKFNTKSKLTFWKVFKQVDDSMLQVLSSMDCQESLPNFGSIDTFRTFHLHVL